MLEDAEQQVGELKELLKVPTPENFEAANHKLGVVFHVLRDFAAELFAAPNVTPKDTAFLSRLPSELAQVQKLFQGPVDFLQGLAWFRAEKFGSYTREGELKSLVQGSDSRILAHL